MTLEYDLSSSGNPRSRNHFMYITKVSVKNDGNVKMVEKKDPDN